MVVKGDAGCVVALAGVGCMIAGAAVLTYSVFVAVGAGAGWLALVWGLPLLIGGLLELVVGGVAAQTAEARERPLSRSREREGPASRSDVGG